MSEAGDNPDDRRVQAILGRLVLRDEGADAPGAASGAQAGVFLSPIGETASSQFTAHEETPVTTSDAALRLMPSHRAGAGRTGPEGPMDLSDFAVLEAAPKGDEDLDPATESHATETAITAPTLTNAAASALDAASAGAGFPTFDDATPGGIVPDATGRAEADAFAFRAGGEESDLRALIRDAVREELLGSAGDAFRETLRQVVREELARVSVRAETNS